MQTKAWTLGYQAQCKGAKIFDNPETGRRRVQWYDGFAAAERETFVLKGAQEKAA